MGLKRKWISELQHSAKVIPARLEGKREDPPRAIVVTCRWAGSGIPEKSYYGLTPGDCEKFVDFWRREVAGNMTVEWAGLPRQGALERILA
jgi:hypothetical protein